jgi:hypothetical protein
MNVGSGRYHLITNYVIYTTHIMLQGSKIKKVKMGSTYNLDGGNNKCTQNFCERVCWKDWKELKR